MVPFRVTRSNPIHQLTDPTQLDLSGKIAPNPTQSNTTNSGAYMLVVMYFSTRNLSVSGTCQIGRKIRFNWLVQLNHISNRALNALI